jgi:hypothetical protein
VAVDELLGSLLGLFIAVADEVYAALNVTVLTDDVRSISFYRTSTTLSRAKISNVKSGFQLSSCVLGGSARRAAGGFRRDELEIGPRRYCESGFSRCTIPRILLPVFPAAAECPREPREGWGMDRVEAGFIVTAITSAMVLVSSIVWLAVM